MFYLLEQVKAAEEFDLIWPVHFQAFHSPYNSYSKFFNPIPTTLDAAIDASKARHIRIWQANPNLHWIKVTCRETGEIVGAACWDVNERGYAEGDASKFQKEFTARQHIQGSDEQAWAEQLIGGLRATVMDAIRSPHVELQQMIVHPRYRRQGIAKMLTQWGTDLADERGFQAVVVSVPFARPVYESLGFALVQEINIDFSRPNLSSKWKEWQDEDMRAFLLVRPPLQRGMVSQ